MMLNKHKKFTIDKNGIFKSEGLYPWKGLSSLTMKEKKDLTAIIEKEGDGYVALCPELDIASQGETIEEARTNLIEALELFYEAASTNEINQRLHEEVLVTRVQVTIWCGPCREKKYALSWRSMDSLKFVNEEAT